MIRYALENVSNVNIR